MNIHELDSYDLGDAVKFNDRLNPRIWGADEKMRPEVREQLLRIADDFQEFLGIDVEIKDITVSGSNAAYTYTPHSDIDLHLVVDLPKADTSEVYRELFDAKKYAYNDMHDIQIGGYDVELYVQDANKQHHSQGIYSIMNDDWVAVPRRRRPDVDDISVKSKFEDLGHRIETAIKSQDYEKISAMAEKIRDYRQAGLDAHGEFGAENLAFKILRTQGLIKQLYDARAAAKNELLSLDERRKKKKKKSVKYGYGGYWYPGTAYAGQDQPAGTEGGGGDGGGESIRESVETADEDILRDFIRFCVKELKIEQMPRVKLRRDPQWSAVHKTFGRYNDDAKTLEVAWGQRHIMDVLRTVAHELTHKHQHEREGEQMGADAGETGSPYENEANARAGVLMRDYGRLHPEYFAVGQVHDLEEANPVQQLSLYNPAGTTYRGEKMPVPDPDDFHSETNPRKRIDRLTHQDLSNRTATDLVDPIERAEQNIDKERLKDAIRASMSSLTSRETAVLNMRFWKDLTLAQTAKALNSSAERIRQIEAKALRKLRHESRSDRLEPFVKESASGYIPTKAQARDPRFSMALTVDIRPGQVGKEANKLKLKTNKQGQPQIARADGLFENLFKEYKQFKADEDYSPDEPPGPEFKPTMPAGTVKVDVSDVYDWYKLGQHISNMKGLGKHDFGQGPPASIISFGDEDTEHKFIQDLKKTGLDVTDIDPVDPERPKGMRKIKTDPTYNVDEAIQAPVSKGRDAEQYYKFILGKAQLGRPLTRDEQDYVKMYQMYRQQKLAESLLNETQTVTRIDSKPITDFASNLKSYKHTDDWSQSGIDIGDDSYWQKRNITPKVTKGLYAGEPHRTALYATGNAHETRYVEFTQNGQPIVYFDQKDLPKMRARKTYLTVFDAANFKKLPTGEYFSDNPGQPIKQTEIGDPFQYIASQGWIVRISDNLDKVFKQVQAMHKAGKIAQYGAEGMNESVGQDLNEDQQLDEVKMSPSALQKWAKSDAAQGIRAGFEAELIFRDTTNDDDDDGDMEPDYDYDERARSVSQVIDFFNGGDYGGLSDRQEGRLQDGLDEQYMEWQDERMRDAFDEEAEDLIRKVLFDEGDWDEDNEIQKQLALLDLTNDEINDIVNAGERAPKFTSSKEQTAYAEANPLYQKYLDAQAEAEGLLDDLVADEVRKKGANWDAAMDDFRENFYVDDDSSFFQDVGLSYMSDIAAEYSLDWPYLTGSGGGNNGGSREWDEIGSSLEKTVGMPVKVSSGYHNATRKEGQWIVEPDSSLRPDDSEDFGLEIVSPPMPLLQALEQLQAVTDWANSPYGSAYTNDSTGLHMGVSVPYKGGDVDYLKLILFLGDEYVLQSFGREANSYTKSAMKKFRENIKGGRADPAGALSLMKSNLIEFAYREIQKGVGTGKYTSAHIQDGYIEFRSAGGDWLAEGDAEPGKLENTMLRYARAMQIAADPSAERREFAKKLYKLVSPEGDSQLALFSQFAAGELTAEQLKKQWAEKTIGTERKTNQRWKLYDRATGEPVAGQEYNGYTEEEARARAKGKISPGASDRDFDSAYELRNMSEDQQWEVYDVNTGKTLEIVQGRNKGEVADVVFDKYAAQKIGFNVRPYQDPATMTPRAKLAKRITQTNKPTDYNYEIVNQADVRLPVVDKFYATNDTDAQKVYSQWLKNKDLPDDTADYGYRKVAAKPAEDPPWVAQNFDSARDSATLQANLQDQPTGDYSAFERNSDRIDAIRAGQDATEVRRNWEFVNRRTGQVIHNMTNASYNQANVVQDNLESRYPDADIYLRSVERSN